MTWNSKSLYNLTKCNLDLCPPNSITQINHIASWLLRKKSWPLNSSGVWEGKVGSEYLRKYLSLDLQWLWFKANTGPATRTNLFSSGVPRSPGLLEGEAGTEHFRNSCFVCQLFLRVSWSFLMITRWAHKAWEGSLPSPYRTLAGGWPCDPTRS